MKKNNAVRQRKRYEWFALLLLLTVGLFAGCEARTASAETHAPSIVSTIFPSFDFARQVAGENAEVSMLLKMGADMHSYEPSPQDIQKVQNSDLFICIGGEMDIWTQKILPTLDTSQMTVIELLDCVDPLEEEYVEGMEHDHAADEDACDHEHAEDCDHDHAAEHAHNHTPEENHTAADSHTHGMYDEHVWTNPQNVITITKRIAEALRTIDNAHKDTYQQNADAFIAQLTALDREFRDIANQAVRKTLLFGDRFPFRYFTEGYGFDYYAAFPGCSTDTDASAATIAFLIDKVNNEAIPVVYYLENGTKRIAETICAETGAVPLLLHSCQTVSADEMKTGIGYLEIMRENAINLRKGLCG